MKHYYRIWDAFAQVFLLLATVYVLLTNLEQLLPYMFVTGVWYSISVGVHLIIGSNSFKKNYKAYAFLTAVIIALVVIGFFSPLVWYMDAFILLYVAPLFAVCYTYICFREILYLRKRPISYLK